MPKTRTMPQEELERKINEIHGALVGTEYNPEGLVKKVDRIEKTVERHSINFKVVALLGIIISAIITFIADVFGIFK